MTELITWAKEYSPPIAFAMAGLAAAIYVLKLVVEKSIETSFERRKKEFELFLQRRSGFWDKVLSERYLLITSLNSRLQKVRTNLNRSRTNHPIPDGFMRGSEIVPLTEIFEDIEIHRLILGERYYELFAALARHTLELANVPDETAWDEVGASVHELETKLRDAADKDFHISQISLDAPD
jgi:hypothetical protein